MKRTLMTLALPASSLYSAAAQAETYVYVHGWLPSGANLSSENNSYSSSYPWGTTIGWPIHVGWDTGSDWRNGVANAKATLDARCLRTTPGASCTVVCHSTGCAVMGRTMDVHGTVNGTPRWRVNRVLALASAEGGSELGTIFGDTVKMADMVGSVFGFSGPVTPSLQFLTPSVVRSAYDHNDTAGTAWLHVAGFDGHLGSFLLPGQDDGIVSFHSACGYVKVFGATQCSNDWEWVRKTSWGVPYYVMREVARWTNHGRVNYCGRDGCDKDHMGLLGFNYQNLATQAAP